MDIGKLQALGKMLKAADEQEKQSRKSPMTRRWFIRALAATAAAVAVGASLKGKADVGPDGLCGTNTGGCSGGNTCSTSNSCATTGNTCAPNTCVNNNTCGCGALDNTNPNTCTPNNCSPNSCGGATGSNTCNASNPCSVSNTCTGSNTCPTGDSCPTYSWFA